MKKHLYTLALLCLFGFIKAQSQEIYKGDTVNKIDIDGKKQGKWVLLGKHKPGTCYAPDAKVEEGKYQDNRKKDVWIEFGKHSHKIYIHPNG